VYPAERVAQTIVRCARRPKREVFVGNSARMLSSRFTMAPGMTERTFATMVDKEYLEDTPAPPGPGNVLEPMWEGSGVSGGWGGQEETQMRRVALMGAAVAVPVLLGWRWLRRA
jgi:hypothetical protein